MASMRTGAPGPTLSFLRQVALSVAATLVATAVVTGVQRHFAAETPAAAVPDLTTGGKFAARVEELEAAAAARAFVPPPPVPVLAWAGTPAPVAAAPFLAAPASVMTPAAEPARPARHVVRVAETRHRPALVAALDVLPPRRPELVADAPVVLTAEPDRGLIARFTPAALWSSAKGAAHDVAWLGGDMIDRISPARLIP